MKCFIVIIRLTFIWSFCCSIHQRIKSCLFQKISRKSGQVILDQIKYYVSQHHVVGNNIDIRVCLLILFHWWSVYISWTGFNLRHAYLCVWLASSTCVLFAVVKTC